MRGRIRSGGTVSNATAVNNGNGEAIKGTVSTLPVVRERRLQKALQSIEAHLPHTVRELAEQVHLSPAHLQRLFKNETGVHISDLLCERRLAMAARLLTTTDMEIKEVAYVVGYGHHSSFVRAFHRRFGESPKAFRRHSAA